MLEGPPGEHAGDGVQVRGIDVAAEARRLEGNLARSAEGVGHLGATAEAHQAELLDQFREGVGVRAEVRVYLLPDMGMNGGDFLGATAVVYALAVGRCGQHSGLEPPSLALWQVRSPGDVYVLVGWVRPVHRARLR